MTEEEIAGLSEGIRDLVILLNEENFHTTDSGDGSNYQDGMGCAVPFPMVAMVVDDPVDLILETDHLRTFLEGYGIDFAPPEGAYENPPETITWPSIQASYDPYDKLGIIVLTNVLSEDLELERPNA